MYGATSSMRMAWPVPVLFISTTGASEVTVTSSTRPAGSENGSCVLVPILTATSLWMKVAYPGHSQRTT